MKGTLDGPQMCLWNQLDEIRKLEEIGSHWNCKYNQAKLWLSGAPLLGPPSTIWVRYSLSFHQPLLQRDSRWVRSSEQIHPYNVGLWNNKNNKTIKSQIQLSSHRTNIHTCHGHAYKSVISSYKSGLSSYISGFHRVGCSYHRVGGGNSSLWHGVSIIHIWRVIIQFWRVIIIFWLSSYRLRLSWYMSRLS